MLKIALLFICLLAFNTVNGQTIPPASFAKDAEYISAKISPDGSKIGVITKHEGNRRLASFSFPAFESLGGIDLGERADVGNFHWVNNERVVIELWQRRRSLEEGISAGELYAINYDGSNGEMIFGYRAGDNRVSGRLSTGESKLAWARIINLLEGDDRHILISSTPMSRDGGDLSTVYELNVYNGKLGRAVTRAPAAMADFVTTKGGDVVFTTGLDADMKKKAFRYNEKWIEISDQVGENFRPLALDDTQQKLFYLDSFGQDKTGLFSLDLTSGERTNIYTDTTVDITQVSFNADRSGVYALRIDSGFPTYVMFNDGGEEAQLFKSFLAAFPGYTINIMSRTKDRKQLILYVSNDTDAGSFYLPTMRI